nr:Crp/Fnr family transcriptional regulator [uncultured Draconibacterium sp.]
MIENLKKHIGNFIAVENTQLANIDKYFQIRELKKKELILKEGEICYELFFVNKGCLQIFYMKENGTEQTIDFALENWWTTDFNAFANKTPSKFSIRTIEPSEILILNKSAQNELLKLIPELERYFHLVFQRAYAASQYRIKLLYELSREELYLHFRDNFPDFIQRVPQYLVASFLGFTPEYLSEIRKKYTS